MSAAEALKAARRAGIQLGIDGDQLLLEASAAPPPAVIDLLSHHKPEIIALLKNCERASGAVITDGAAKATAALLAKFNTKPRLLNSTAEAKAAILTLLTGVGTDGVIGADIETTPLVTDRAVQMTSSIDVDEALDPYRSAVRALSLYNPRGDSVLLIDLRYVPISELPEALWSARFVFHNATFDTKHLLHSGATLQAGKLLCSMLAAGFVARGEAAKSREGNRRPALAVAAKELLVIDVPKEGQIADWSQPHLDQRLQDYAALDAVLAYQLLTAAVEQMSSQEQKAFEIACGCIHAVARLELEGLPFDAEAHRITALRWKEELRVAQDKVTRLTGISNPNSSVQIVKWLPQVLPSTVLREWPRTETGKFSTEGKVLRRHSHYHEGLEALASCSKLKPLVGTFGLPLLEKINPVTKRLHTSLQIAQAKSGRFSSKNPGLQNLPRGDLVRSAVRCQPGHKLIVADYNQIELRILAEAAGDSQMREAYASGRDLHALTAATILGIAPEQFDKKNPDHAAARQKAKGVNFGIVYGSGARGLVAFVRDSYGVEMDEAEANAVLANWRRTYQQAAAWQMRQERQCQDKGAVCTPAGRSYSFAWEANGRFNRQLALNLPIQGGAAEVAQVAMAMIDESLTKNLGERSRLVGQVHDEFLVIAHEAAAEPAKMLLVEAMIAAFSQLFPNAPVRDLVEVKISTSWSEAKQ